MTNDRPKSRSRHLRSCISGGAIAAALAWGGAARAQAPETQSQTQPAAADAAASTQAAANPANTGAPAGNGSNQDEIVVTAQFREQNLQQTPLAITAMSGAMLEARSQTSVASVADQAPSVTLKPQGAAFGPALGANIRGVGQFDFNPALEPGVGVYVDDVYYSTLVGSIFDLLDLDRVEILRGPQGTLAGKNSIGGAIKLYSKKPTGSNTGYVSATYGIRDRIDLRASADFKVADNLFARIAGVAKKQDGYIKRLDFGCVNPPGSSLNPAVGGIAPTQSAGSGCVVAREGEVNYQAIRGQLRYEPSDTFEINIIGDYTNDDRTSPGAVLISANNSSPQVRGTATAVPYDNRFVCGRYCNYASYVSPAGAWAGPVATGFPLTETRGTGRTRFEGWGVSGQIDWSLSDVLKLTSITAYRSYDAEFSNDDDASPLPVGNGLSQLHFWSVSQELRLNGSLANEAIEYTLGGFYQDQRSVYPSYQDIRYAAIPLQFQQNDPVNADTKAVFAHVNWHITDRLTATGGVRYTEEHKDYTFSRRNRDGTVNAFLGVVDGQVGIYDGNRVDWRANLQYQLTDDVMAYVQASTGFKGGGISPRPYNIEQVRPFNPEKLTAYEGGIKSELFDRLLRLNLAAYFSDYKGIQLSFLSCPQFGGPGPCALIANAGDAHIKGFEIESTLRPMDGMSIDASASYTDFQYQYIDPLAGGPSQPGGPQFGDVPPYTPKWKWSAGAQYEIPLGDIGSLTPRVDAAYQSTVYSGSSNTEGERLRHYTVANARLTYRNTGGDLEVSGEVTNLFDKYYYLTGFDLTAAGSGITNRQPGRPREWALTVKKKF